MEIGFKILFKFAAEVYTFTSRLFSPVHTLFMNDGNRCSVSKMFWHSFLKHIEVNPLTVSHEIILTFEFMSLELTAIKVFEIVYWRFHFIQFIFHVHLLLLLYQHYRASITPYQQLVHECNRIAQSRRRIKNKPQQSK